MSLHSISAPYFFFFLFSFFNHLTPHRAYCHGRGAPYYLIDCVNLLTQIPLHQDEHLWELDLSIKFAVSTPPWTAHSKPQDWNQHYNGASGALWDIGDGKFYTSGGWMSSGMEGPPPGKAVGEPYFTRNSSGSHFQLPDPRVFAYDPKTGNWSSSLLEKGIHRLSDAAYAQSATNRVGYTLGGLLVTESSNALPGYVPNVLPNFIEDVGLPNFVTVESNEQWVYRMTKYDFRSGEFTKIPTKVDITSRAVMHSLERIGDEGILVAFAGRYNNNTQFVSLYFHF